LVISVSIFTSSPAPVDSPPAGRENCLRDFVVVEPQWKHDRAAPIAPTRFVTRLRQASERTLQPARFLQMSVFGIRTSSKISIPT